MRPDDLRQDLNAISNLNMFQVYSLAEFNFIIMVSKLRGALVNLGGSNVWFSSSADTHFMNYAINATKYFTSTYWSAGFFMAVRVHSYTLNKSSINIGIYGFRRK